jgi:hypothetical protein
MAVDLSQHDNDYVWSLIKRPDVRQVVLTNLDKSRHDQVKLVREVANLTILACENPVGVAAWVIDLVSSGA